jgi:hypothetical protein
MRLSALAALRRDREQYLFVYKTKRPPPIKLRAFVKARGISRAI